MRRVRGARPEFCRNRATGLSDVRARGERDAERECRGPPQYLGGQFRPARVDRRYMPNKSGLDYSKALRSRWLACRSGALATSAGLVQPHEAYTCGAACAQSSTIVAPGHGRL